MRNLLALICVLALQSAALAQEWSLEHLSAPWWIQPGDTLALTLTGPPNSQGQIQIEKAGVSTCLELKEVSQGNYLALVKPPTTGLYSLSLLTKGAVKSLGQLEVAKGLKTFTALTSTITRQGPNPDFDRCTPLIAGAQVAVSASYGSWYRAANSNNWLDGSQGQVTDGPPAPSRLSRIVVDSYPNKDAKLTFSCGVIPQVEATNSSDGSLHLILSDTEQMIFDIKKPLGAASFLGPIAVRPATLPRGVIVAIAPAGQSLKGYQLEPGSNPGEFVLRVRAPIPTKLSDLIITLDAGHGGEVDTGTVGHLGLAEKTLNLRVAQALAQKLKASGATVVMTRTTDSSVGQPEDSASQELQARIDRSVAANANLFISLHHNARPDVEEGKRYHGTDVYWYQPASEALAQALAEPIAKAVGEPLCTTRYRSFYVIRQTFSPAVLIEFQYLSNPKLEAKLLSSSEYPEKAAAGVLEGILNYLKSK